MSLYQQGDSANWLMNFTVEKVDYINNYSKMESLINLESVLYNRELSIESLEYVDSNSIASILVFYPQIRPFFVDRAIRVCQFYCQNPEYRKNILEKSFLSCPHLLYCLYKSSIVTIDEIIPVLQSRQKLNSIFHFRNEIPGFLKVLNLDSLPHTYQLLINDKNLPLTIQYGFHPSSIGYCLKYDDIKKLRSIFQNPSFSSAKLIDWSNFEWALQPQNLDLVSVSCYFGSVNCFKFLLMNGCRVFFHTAEYSYISNHVDIIHLCHGYYGSKDSFIQSATLGYHIDLIHHLLDNGYDINNKDSKSYTPLHVAVEYNHYGLVKLLIERNANINIDDPHGSILHVACFNKNYLIVEYLIEKGAQLEKVDSFGYTPICCAVERGSLDIVKLLVSKGADFKVLFRNGNNLLHLASSYHQCDIYDFLLSIGLRFNIKNSEFFFGFPITPLFIF